MIWLIIVFVTLTIATLVREFNLLRYVRRWELYRRTRDKFITLFGLRRVECPICKHLGTRRDFSEKWLHRRELTGFDTTVCSVKCLKQLPPIPGIKSIFQ